MSELTKVKEEYKKLKSYYNLYKKELINPNLDESFREELKCEASMLVLKIESLRRKLISLTIGRISPINLLDRFIDGNLEELGRGSR